MRNAPSPWTPALQQRWQRIRMHAIGGAEAIFVARLAREQVWSRWRARRALREYRRFVFLAVAAGHRVAPPGAVDAVWHLHLLFTRDYWTAFCTGTLGIALHHEPELRPQDAALNDAQYAMTVASYRRFFGTPSAHWWPAPRPRTRADPASGACAERPPGLRERVVAGCRRLLPVPLACGLLLLPSPASAARSSNPLQWSGGEFLSLYLGLMLLVGIGSLLLRRMLRRRVATTNRLPGEMDDYEIALLLGGAQRVIDTAVVDLHQRGALQWDAAKKRFARTRISEPLPPLLASVASAMGSESSLNRAWNNAARAIEPIQAALVKRGLWLDSATTRRIAWQASLPSLLLLGLGIAKIGVGIARDRPVGLLVLLSILTAVFALVTLLSRPRRSRSGDTEAARVQVMHTVRQSRPARDSNDARGDRDLVHAVAIGGTAILAGTALLGYHQARAAAGSSSADGSAGSDSGSDGGSGCGGCGGGD